MRRRRADPSSSALTKVVVGAIGPIANGGTIEGGVGGKGSPNGAQPATLSKANVTVTGGTGKTASRLSRR